MLEMGNRDFYLKHFLAKDWKREGDVLLLTRRDFDYLCSRIDSSFELYRRGALAET